MDVININRGDSKEFTVTLRDGAGSPLNLTGLVLRSSPKRRTWDSDEDAVFIKTEGNGVTITDTPGGLATLTIDPEDTDGLVDCPNLFCDVQVVSGSNPVTAWKGILQVFYDVTIGHGS